MKATDLLLIIVVASLTAWMGHMLMFSDTANLSTTRSVWNFLAELQLCPLRIPREMLFRFNLKAGMEVLANYNMKESKKRS